LKKKILVVDDEKDIRDILKWFFQSKDYEVIEAEDGKQCLAMMDEVRPDLILMDIMMPDLDGWEVSRRIKEDESYRDIPVSMLSVLSNADDVKKSMDYAHADAHISKPIDFYALNNTVKDLTTKRPKKPGRLGPRPRSKPSELFGPTGAGNT
jgi:CheY-like chemotaxis protein